VTDYGTEFIVTVMPDGRTEVRVLTGRVELVPLGGRGDMQAGQMLTAGQSGMVDPFGDLTASASSQADPLTTFIVREEPERKRSPKSQPDRRSSLTSSMRSAVATVLVAAASGVSVSLVDGTVSDGFVFRPDTLSNGGYLVCRHRS